jgi:flagellar protein FlgJ
MAIESAKAAFYADPASLAGLKQQAAQKSPEALREAARQFESLFTTMMLKSMRDASPKDSLFGSDQQDFYQDMFDQQLAVQLSKGKGLGLSDMLVRQLMQGGASEADALGGMQGALTGRAAATAPGAASAAWPPASREEFVRVVTPAAEKAAAQLGVDADLVVAHAALESGWGRSLPADASGRTSFNLFGIKADSRWSGSAATARTHEFTAGRMEEVSASFRAYGSPEQSMQDYVDFLKSNPRYAGALNTGGDATAFARGLQRGGYATDPDYVAKLTAVAAQLKSTGTRPISLSDIG